MKRSSSVARWCLLLVALPLTAAGLGVLSAPASACEKHLNGHQNGSETEGEVQGERR
ncbi:MAG: hypothetical protein NTX18_06890 [Cyanobium sp. LacPavin_0818_WC50_MAG_67_9]|jgi:hypothetical protein|nr:hypothetical protein [Cyanobium sp. LacPavin_0818_WC50_MAG_67_9]